MAQKAIVIESSQVVARFMTPAVYTCLMDRGGGIYVDYQHLVTYRMSIANISNAGGQTMADEKSDILHGTLYLMILRTLDVLGSMHGYGIARRIEQVSRGVLELNQGTLYPALLQLQQAGL